MKDNYVYQPSVCYALGKDVSVKTLVNLLTSSLDSDLDYVNFELSKDGKKIYLHLCNEDSEDVE